MLFMPVTYSIVLMGAKRMSVATAVTAKAEKLQSILYKGD